MTPNVESSTMTDRVVTTSQLSSIPSTSSIPSLASSPSAETNTHFTDPLLSALQPHEMPPTSRAERTTLDITTSRPQRYSPFESFSSSKTSGPFHPLSRGNIAAQIHLVTAISFACLHFLHTASATAATLEHSLEQQQQQQQQHRRLEEEWTGEWNGEWTASQDDDYVYECGENCNDDNASSKADSGSMWLDSDPLAWTPDQVITYVSVGLLSFMTLLCCVCYPEILVVTFRKLCGCCLGGSAAAAGGAGADGTDEATGGDYVGGKLEKSPKKKKRRSRSSTKSSRSRSRSKSKSKDIELV
eukprot:CAMPEP_0201603664 /NCGR_PEP_ID=MMETSP0492-20130828/4041_1 /ASSEMBLY_ACC=CAM_ASM_000837 /TAXON_ID=420259 /ORGANISM="Thalassiosira gravida, Strain GMp14c1" /LENGTH=300 /DNA_ID=CAMNT_0048067493 /DNA_START=569 /DNA_END=1471 /DNA_ORIENTATION=-